jgi:transposase
MPDDHDLRRKRILDAYAKTGSIKGTRRKTGHSIGLIRKVLRGEDRPRKAPATTKRPSKLDPYRPMLQRLIVEDALTAVLALEELRAAGFDGGYSIVKEAVRRIRPSRAKKATTVVDHPPGAEGQVDWSPYWVRFGLERVQVHAFSLVLPFSRWMFVRFALDETLETLLTLHGEAFGQLGAVPHVMSYDNMTTVGRHIGPDEIWINPRFAPYAAEHDFEVKLIRPGKPNDHASVERPMHYIENNCLRRRRFRFDDLEDLNGHAAWWCEQVANVRVHGTTRQRPIDRFRSERAFLKPLPADRPEPFHTLFREVQSDYCVAVDTNRYSVSPDHIGKPATVYAFAQRIAIWIDGEEHATHARCMDKHQRRVLPEHEEQFKRHTPSRRLLEGAFLRLGPDARSFYEGLRAQRGKGAGYHIKRLLNLADRHGSGPVVAAMNHAARFGAYSADAVAKVLAGRTLKASATPTGEVPMPPERVRAWLEGLDVEGADLGDYDEWIDGQQDHQEEDDDGE